MIMTSNAYVATDGETVMKVGKANDVKRRERQIAIPIKYTIACLDEAAAFRVESQLRDFVIKKGGIQFQGTIDWFKFDLQIYTMLCEFASSVDAEAIPERDLDEEIEELVTYYYLMIIDELKAENQRLHDESQRLREEIKELRLSHAMKVIHEDDYRKTEELLKGACELEGELREELGYLKTLKRMAEEGHDIKMFIDE